MSEPCRTKAGKGKWPGGKQPRQLPLQLYRHIRWERQLNRLRLYGPEPQLDLIEAAAIMNHLQHHSESLVQKAVPLPAQVYRHLVLHCKEELGQLQQQSGVQR
jgi:hypothetical protein